MILPAADPNRTPKLRVFLREVPDRGASGAAARVATSVVLTVTVAIFSASRFQSKLHIKTPKGQSLKLTRTGTNFSEIFVGQDLVINCLTVPTGYSITERVSPGRIKSLVRPHRSRTASIPKRDTRRNMFPRGAILPDGCSKLVDSRGEFLPLHAEVDDE